MITLRERSETSCGRHHAVDVFVRGPAYSAAAARALAYLVTCVSRGPLAQGSAHPGLQRERAVSERAYSGRRRG